MEANAGAYAQAAYYGATEADVAAYDGENHSGDYQEGFPRTLPTALATVMRENPRPLSEDDLVRLIEGFYNELRKPDGSEYTANIKRAVRGSLCSMGLFEKLEGGLWTLREDSARDYEQKLHQRQAAAKQQKLQQQQQQQAQQLHKLQQHFNQEQKQPDTIPRTLPIALASIIRESQRPVPEDELIRHIERCSGDLRKPDGTRYTSDIKRAVRGSLCSTGIFEKLEGGLWCVQEENARIYEQKLRDRVTRLEEEKVHKRKQPGADVDHLGAQLVGQVPSNKKKKQFEHDAWAIDAATLLEGSLHGATHREDNGDQ